MWSPGWEQSLGENGYMYMYGWVPSLFTWNSHNIVNWLFAVVQSLSHVQRFVTVWTAACQASLSFTGSWSLLRLMSIDLVMPSNHLIRCCFCCPLLLLLSIFSSIRVFSNELTLHIRWQVLELQFHHQCLQRISRVGFLKDWLASSPCTPKDSQESATTPQFKTINSSALSLL